MNVAYFTPLNPQKSGISDFAEEMLPYLAEHMAIVIYTDGKPSNAAIRDHFDVAPISFYRLQRLENDFELAVYQVGNQHRAHKPIVDSFMEHGGVLELHDISLHRYMAQDTLDAGKQDAYIALMKDCHGEQGEQLARDYCQGLVPAPWEDRGLEFTLNKRLIDRADAIIVHSDFAKQMVKGVRPEVPVAVIPLPADRIVDKPAAFQARCRQALRIDTSLLVLGSFGYLNQYKRIPQILRALARFKQQYRLPFRYYLVGQNEGEKLDGMIQELGLAQEVVQVGYAPKEAFCQYIGACDICLNLRYPTQGESSGGIHRMFGMGKPVLVSDTGSFAEYPDNAVVKIRYDENEEDDLCNTLLRLANDRRELEGLSRGALAYAKKECDPEQNAKRYVEFLSQVDAGVYQERGIERFVDRLFEIGLTSPDYIDHLMKLKF